ncbi:MAG: RNA-binding protein [Candidatus Omnitrophota bacterium]
MNIFVGNLSFKASEADVKNLFEGFGSVVSVRIVMEKKGDKSRGFGFVEMSDEQQALAAIGALSGREFMGRPLNVSPVRPKPEAERDKGEAKKSHQERPKEKGDKKDAWYNQDFNKKMGRYKRGRRSQSFMKRSAASGIAEEASLKRESRENPMRWRKKYEQPKPWKKRQGEPKPWKKTDGGAKPLGKSTVEPKPLKRKEGEFKPWRKSVGGKPNSWSRNKRRSRPRQSQIESRRKPGGYVRGN